MTYTFEISGDPIAKKRPRFSKNGTYDVQSKEKNAYLWSIRSQIALKGILKPIEGPIEMEMIFYTSMPKSVLKSKRKALETDGTFDWRRPDLDNYQKFILDVLNSYLYHDDAQIVKIYACKMYSLEPKTIFTVKQCSQESYDNAL